MKAKFALTALAALLLSGAAVAQGQGTAQPAAVAPTKVGVVNLRLAILSTLEGKQASVDLQGQFASRQNELENLRKQIEDLQTKLRAGQNTLPDEEKVRMQRQGEALSRSFQRKQQDLQDDLNYAENEVGERIGRKMQEVADRYSRENGFAVVMDVSSQSSTVFVWSNQVDITQDVIRLFDQTYPIKAGASAPAQPAPARPSPQPGQPRPTQPPPQTPPQKPPQQ